MAFLLLLLGNVVAVQLISGIPTAILDCTHDFERVSCQLKSQNCSENSLTLIDYLKEQYDCPLQQCSSEQCCCSAEFMLIYGEHFTADVNNKSELKTFYVTESFKPKAPTIKSVKESNGNFQVRWITNMDGKTWNPEETEITLYKKGDTETVSKYITLAKNNQYHEINGQDLDPGGTYVVSLRSFSDQSKKFSDSSQEWEFETPASRDAHLYWISIGLSVFSAIIIAALYVCLVKLKEKWWDNIPKPKITMILKPPTIESVDLCIVSDPPLNKTAYKPLERKHPDMDRKADLRRHPEKSPVKDRSCPRLLSSIRKGFSTLLPSCSGQKQGDGSAAQRQAEEASDYSCLFYKSSIVTDLDQQGCLFPPQHDSSFYKKKSSSCSNPITSKGLKSVNESNEWSNVFPCIPDTPDLAEEMHIFENPACDMLPHPVVSHGFFPVEDKPCQCQVDQSDALKSNAIEVFAEVPSGDHNLFLNINTNKLNEIPPNSFQPAENPTVDPTAINGQVSCIFPNIPNDGSIILINEYHCV